MVLRIHACIFTYSSQILKWHVSHIAYTVFTQIVQAKWDFYTVDTYI